MNKELKDELTTSLLMNKFIKEIVKEFHLTVEQEEKLHKIASDDIRKLYERNKDC